MCLALMATKLVYMDLFSIIRFMHHYTLSFYPSILWCDSLSAVHLSANHILHSKTKHVVLDIFFVRDLVQKKKIHVCHLLASQQVVDILTKPLSASSFHKLKNKLTVINTTTIGL